MANKIQFGKSGTMLDYRREGGENNLYRFKRLTAELNGRRRHNFIFLYQPLDVRTQALLDHDLTVDSLTFAAGTPMDFRYGFDFYRVSYLHDFLSADEKEFAIGLSLQVRNASISFASQDGRQFRINQNVGPVPAIKLRTELPLGVQSWFGLEVDGFYATTAFLNGAKFSFTGSILDASLRYGYKFNESLAGFLNARFLGGTAKGESQYAKPPSDGYTDNTLGTVSLSVGCYVK